MSARRKREPDACRRRSATLQSLFQALPGTDRPDGGSSLAFYLKKGLIFRETYSIIMSAEQTESCPSWSKEHDWKSCKPSKRLRGFESLALRQKPMKHKMFRRLSFFAFYPSPRRRKPTKTTSRRRNIFEGNRLDEQAKKRMPCFTPTIHRSKMVGFLP